MPRLPNTADKGVKKSVLARWSPGHASERESRMALSESLPVIASHGGAGNTTSVGWRDWLPLNQVSGKWA